MKNPKHLQRSFYKKAFGHSKSVPVNFSEVKSPLSQIEQVNVEVPQIRETANICYQILDRHLGTDIENKTALRCISKNWFERGQSVNDISYRELADLTCRFAHGLKRLGVKNEDTVFSLLPRNSEFYVTSLGTLRSGASFCPLFLLDEGRTIQNQLKMGRAVVLVTLASVYNKTIATLRNEIPSLKYIILINDIGEEFQNISFAIEYSTFMSASDGDYFCESVSAQDRALIHFTGGAAGTPKIVEHTHYVALYHKISGQTVLDFHGDDIFWCMADSGTGIGTFYGVISPLANGLTLLLDEAEFRIERCYKILQDFKVTVWYTNPNFIRKLMNAGDEIAWDYDFTHVRFACSYGEPLTSAIIKWCEQNLGISMLDSWWQTEAGGIIFSNYCGAGLKSGSMGKPVPGVEVSLVRANESQSYEFITSPFEKGEIAIKRNSYGLLKKNNDKKKLDCGNFAEEWHLTGDLAYKDDQDYYWFLGRCENAIFIADEVIGSYEIESILLEHPAVSEAAVVAKSCNNKTVVKAFIVLNDGFIPSKNLTSNIMIFSQKLLGSILTPKEIVFMDSLPKAVNGSTMYRCFQ
ncbi:MAG: AMP-binding protein [Pseudobdellovibrionaceae bacterium]